MLINPVTVRLSQHHFEAVARVLVLRADKLKPSSSEGDMLRDIADDIFAAIAAAETARILSQTN
jgi:hypothetical protein